MALYRRRASSHAAMVHSTRDITLAVTQGDSAIRSQSHEAAPVEWMNVR